MVRMALTSIFWIAGAAMQWIVGGAGAEAATLTVEDGDTHAESSEIDAGDDAHNWLLAEEMG
jgi:hypothetical protein